MTVPLAVAAAAGAESVHAHVIALVADDGGAALEANILSFARRRRLGMSDISVASVSVETFSPTPAPTPEPTTPHPSALPTTVVTGKRGGGSDDDGLSTFVIIIVAVVAILIVAFALIFVASRSDAARVRQEESKGKATPAADDEEGKAEQIEVRVRTPDRPGGDSTLRF